MGIILAQNPDIIKKARQIPYYYALRAGNVDLVEDLRQDYWEAVLRLDDDTDIPLAICKIRGKLLDKVVRSRTYQYSSRGKFKVNSTSDLGIDRQVQKQNVTFIDELGVESRQYLDWIEEDRLKTIIFSYYYEGKTQSEVGEEQGLKHSMISKELQRGIRIIRERSDN